MLFSVFSFSRLLLFSISIGYSGFSGFPTLLFWWFYWLSIVLCWLSQRDSGGIQNPRLIDVDDPILQADVGSSHLQHFWDFYVKGVLVSVFVKLVWEKTEPESQLVFWGPRKTKQSNNVRLNCAT